ncbi:MAG: hypothetical protein AB9872_10735 [Solidesulfovibrio sp.]
MKPIAPLPALGRVLILAALLTTGCGAGYVNPDITNPAEAKSRLASDKSLCQQLANEAVAPTYGMDRFESDPTIEAQATRYVANAVEDDANENVYTRCMRDRGWRSR